MKQFLLGGVAAVIALNASALAQTAENEDEIAPITLAQLDEITVYATRNPLPAFDYPGQVTVIGRDVIDDFNPSTISDVFSAVPGSRFSGGPRRTGETPNVRGLSGEGVLVLFDGARQSFLSGHDGRFFADPDLVQTVEVVRGPTSALYGSGALGGVIALRTITAADVLQDGERASVKVGAGFQSVNNEWRVTGTGVWRSEDETVDVVGNFTLRNSEDIELGSGLTLPAEDEIVSSLLKTTIHATDDLTFSASWIRFGGDSLDPNNPQGVNVAGRGNSLVQRDIDANTLQGTVNYAPDTEFIDLNLVGYYTKTSVNEDEVDTTREISREVETIGFVLDNRSRFSFGDYGGLTLTYGGEYYRDEQVGLDNTTPDGTRGGVPDATANFYGAFIQAELELKRPLGAPGVLTIIPGVRWDRFENDADGEPSTDDEAVSPKVGVSYKPIDELIFFGNWSEAFRAPSINELYADGVHFQIPDFSGPPGPPRFVTNFFVANADLVPEESETWEVGAGVDFSNLFFDGDGLTAKASYYSSDVTNLIDLDVNIPAGCFGAPFPPCGSGQPFGNTSQNVNVTNAEITGFEAEAHYDSQYYYARANFATIDGEDADTGDFVGVLSPDVFFIDTGVKLPAADLRLGARVTVAGRFDTVNDATLVRDDYATGDVYAVWQPSHGPLEGLRVDIGVDNVTDADYEVVAAGVSEPGRNYKAAISWRQGF
ncbi:MAG: TonB-dependent receptor [Pseudomonadota bacterium]